MQLFTLGALDLRSDGRDTGAVLAQSKRLGLLAYLATARPYRQHRRDSLLALFWPQLGTMEGRRALRQALHFLRQALGDDTIVSHGETIGVAEPVWCDTRAFELALESDAPSDALALYRGDFLEGFHVADASSQFEHWLEGERMYLRQRAVLAAWQVADREDARGDGDRASYWARRATELHATNEHSIRKLIEMLGRQGDPRGAMHAYESFARRMEQEYQLAPARETVALIESLRQRNG